MIVVLNRKGIKDLLRSEGTRHDLKKRADRIAAQAGPGLVAHSEIGPNRARAEVVTDTMEARYAEATSRALTRAIDAGR